MYVEGEAVERHPLLHVDSDAGDLASAGPHPRQSRIGSRADAQPPECPDERRLKLPQVPVQVLPMPPEIEYGVAHQLAGPVEGDVAAPLDLEHFHASALQL